jgi:hypothetical protein
MPAVKLAHLLAAHRLGATHAVVEGRRRDPRACPCPRRAGWVDRDAAHVVLAGHRDLDEAGARLALDLDVGEFVLRLLQVVLHRLGLLHQAGELSLHHGFSSWEFTTV